MSTYDRYDLPDIPKIFVDKNPHWVYNKSRTKLCLRETIKICQLSSQAQHLLKKRGKIYRLVEATDTVTIYKDGVGHTHKTYEISDELTDNIFEQILLDVAKHEKIRPYHGKSSPPINDFRRKV